jgi:hypothetical protein
MCTALEQLVIYRMPAIPLAPDLPPTIEHFAFRNDRNHGNTLLPILNAVDALP